MNTMDEKCILDPQRDCIGAAKAALLEKRIEDLERWQQDSKQFHNDFYDWQRTQIARDAKLDEQLITINKNMEKVVAWQEAQQAKPGNMVDSVKTSIILAVIAAFIGYILGQFGL